MYMWRCKFILEHLWKHPNTPGDQDNVFTILFGRLHNMYSLIRNRLKGHYQ